MAASLSEAVVQDVHVKNLTGNVLDSVAVVTQNRASGEILAFGNFTMQVL